MQNNRYKLARIIADLRNGFCMSIVKNARKTLYFAKDTIHIEVLKALPKHEILTTKEWFSFNKKEERLQNVILNENLDFLQNASDCDDLAIKIVKIAELMPMLIKIDGENFQPEVPFENIDFNEINFEVRDFQCEISLISKAQIQLSVAQNCEIYIFGSKYGGHQHYAILVNNPIVEKVPLVRVHSSCYTGDLISSLRCDCGDQLKNAIAEMNKSSGILLYIMQEGRGIGLANKIKAYELQQSCELDTVESNTAIGFEDDERSFVPAAKILEYFGKNEINLLTNNPKKAEDLSSLGIKILKTTPTCFNPHKENEEYLKVKQEKMGHRFLNN